MILFCSLGMFASLYTVLTYIGDMIIHESKRVCHICCIWHSTNKTWVIFITLSLGIMDSKWWSWECPLEWEITLFVYNCYNSHAAGNFRSDDFSIDTICFSAGKKHPICLWILFSIFHPFPCIFRTVVHWLLSVFVWSCNDATFFSTEKNFLECVEH